MVGVRYERYAQRVGVRYQRYSRRDITMVVVEREKKVCPEGYHHDGRCEVRKVCQEGYHFGGR